MVKSGKISLLLLHKIIHLERHHFYDEKWESSIFYFFLLLNVGTISYKHSSGDSEFTVLTIILHSFLCFGQ